MDLVLRKATSADMHRVYCWRNEKETVDKMGSVKLINLTDHQEWYRKSIASPFVLFFIIEGNGRPIGQIRYHAEILDGIPAGKVSINITAKMHGKGIATQAFILGKAETKNLKFCTFTFANVRVDNVASIRAMENAGYKKVGIVNLHGVEHVRMVES